MHEDLQISKEQREEPAGLTKRTHTTLLTLLTDYVLLILKLLVFLHELSGKVADQPNVKCFGKAAWDTTLEGCALHRV